MRKIRPVPEILKGKPFEVREAQKVDEAYVDLATHQMVVPFDDSERAEVLRSHEMMHVSISPFDQAFEMDAHIEDRTLQAAEDARIWQEMNRVGIRADQVDVAENEKGRFQEIALGMIAKGATQEQVEIEMARLFLARHGTGSESWIGAEIMDMGFEKSVKVADEIYSKFYQPYKGTKMPFEPVIEACEYLTEYFSEPEPIAGGGGEGEGQEGDGEGEEREGEGNSGSSSAGGESSGDPQESLPDRGDGSFGDDDRPEPEDSKPEENSDPQDKPEPKKPKEKVKKKPSIAPVKPEGEEVEKLPEGFSESELTDCEAAGVEPHVQRNGKTGEMIIWHPPLTKPFRPKKGRKKVATDLGVNPANIHRMTIDHKVFSEKSVRDYGVVILIDCSGSMTVREEDIQRVLQECPAATIALYGSNDRTERHDLSSGVLKVIVERKAQLDVSAYSDRGTYSRDGGILKGIGGGNVVDLPAIEWLSKRREEIKIWVCDGMCTGKNDQLLSAPELRKIVRLVLEKNIRRATSLSELLSNSERLMR